MPAGWNRRLAAVSIAAAIGCSAALAGDPPAKTGSPAQDSPETERETVIGLAWYTQLASDYNFRGISQSNRQVSVQNFVEVQYLKNLIYTGIYTWQVRLPTRPAFEMDLVAGIRPTFGPLSFDLGVLYYHYPGERRLFASDGITPLTTANTDFVEYGGRANWQVNDALSLGASFYHAPSILGQHAIGSYASGSFVYALPETLFSYLPEAYAGGFSLSGEAGYYILGAAKTSATGFAAYDLPSYAYGNIGVSWTFGDLVLDARYHTTDVSARTCFHLTGDFRGFTNGGTSRWCGDAVIGTIRWQGSTASPAIFAAPEGLRSVFE